MCNSHIPEKNNSCISPSLGCLEVITWDLRYQADILEQFEISKMAAKMAADANRKITFEPVELESQVIPRF